MAEIIASGANAQGAAAIGSQYCIIFYDGRLSAKAEIDEIYLMSIDHGVDRGGNIALVCPFVRRKHASGEHISTRRKTREIGTTHWRAGAQRPDTSMPQNICRRLRAGLESPIDKSFGATM